MLAQLLLELILYIPKKLIMLIKSKIILRICLANSDCTNVFVYKDKSYSKDKFLRIKTREYMSYSKHSLLKMIEKRENTEKRENIIDALNLEAMKSALHSK